MNRSIALTPDVYHVGDLQTSKGLDCHPYLLIDGEEALLIDPGSNIDIEIVLRKILNLIPLSQIKYIILDHEDPDFCSGVPYLEKNGLDATIVTSWRTQTLIQYYGIESPYYLIEEHHNKLILKSGRTIEFIPAPYLHFAGSFVTYDAQSKTLFSGDLFGAFTYNRTLYADEEYVNKMIAFHEHYMPSNSILRPVMTTLEKYDILRILPQHGSLIIEDPYKYIRILKELECGTLIHPIKKNLIDEGGYLKILNNALCYIRSIYNPEEVHTLFESLPGLIWAEDQSIEDYTEDGLYLWQLLFDNILESKGLLWLSVLDPFVKNITSTYGIEVPRVYNTWFETAEKTNQKLIAQNEALEATINGVQERYFRCPITGLFNENFTRNLLLEEFEMEVPEDIGSFMLISIDDFEHFKNQFGEEETKNTLIHMAYLLKEHFGGVVVFKMRISDFAVYLKDFTAKEAIEMAEAFRVSVASSPLFIIPLTVSIGMVFSSEIQLETTSIELAADNFIDTCLYRLDIAEDRGKNLVVYEGSVQTHKAEDFKVLLVDSDSTHLDVLKTFISEMEMAVYTATDGEAALALAHEVLPNVIISDVILPKMDGFLLRERLLQKSQTKHIDFIYCSHQKDDASVRRATALDVVHYLKKPYLLSELLGITNTLRKGLMR